MMLGVNQAVRDGETVMFEYLRIVESESDLTYVASPRGRPGTEFPVVDSGAGYVVFANPEHDFPQRIEYRLADDGTLHVRVSARSESGESALQWTWTRAAPDDE